MKIESLIKIYMYDSKKWFTLDVYRIVFCKQETSYSWLNNYIAGEN